MIVKDAIAEASPDAAVVGSRRLPWNFCFVTLVFCGAFSVYLLAIVTLKGLNLGFSSFDQFKALLGVSETVFGAYVGYLMPTLFTESGRAAQRTPSVGEAPRVPGA